MLKYLLKRILIFIPTLMIISFIGFGLGKMTPGDPVELYLHQAIDSGQGSVDAERAERLYREISELLNLDKPAFYFSLTSVAYPDTFHRILRQNKRETLSKLVAQYGNWPEISNYYQSIKRFEYQTFAVPDSIHPNAVSKIRGHLRDLYNAHTDAKINSYFKKIEKQLSRPPKDTSKASSYPKVKDFLDTFHKDLTNQYASIQSSATPNKLYIPTLYWHGLNNQYHHWMSSFLVGDFGKSYQDNRPVADKMKDAAKWTILLNFLAIFFAYLLAIPLGVFSAARKDSRFDKVTGLVLFMMYSLPVFWIATMLVVFLTTPDYGLQIFPPVGLGKLSSSAPFWSRFFETAGHLILPVFCLTYGSLAFISRQMRGSMLSVLQQDYIRTAHAKGLDEPTVIWKHAFRNSLFPIITLFAGIFPSAIAGSVILEVIFAIPGMGKLAYDAIFAQDWPLVYTVLMLGAILTMIGILVADILYAAVDPRVNFKKA